MIIARKPAFRSKIPSIMLDAGSCKIELNINFSHNDAWYCSTKLWTKQHNLVNLRSESLISSINQFQLKTLEKHQFLLHQNLSLLNQSFLLSLLFSWLQSFILPTTIQKMPPTHYVIWARGFCSCVFATFVSLLWYQDYLWHSNLVPALILPRHYQVIQHFVLKHNRITSNLTTDLESKKISCFIDAKLFKETFISF